MKVLLYDKLDANRIPNFAKVKSYLEDGDYRSAEAKKVADNLYRARLDRTDRILFCFGRYQNELYILVLEHIVRHAYEKSRFLKRGVTIDEAKLPVIHLETTQDAPELAYLNPRWHSFNLLDKIISFDDAQHDVFSLEPPFILIGSAGSGKTVLTLEKMKNAEGNVLYVTRSPYLVDNSRETYYGMNYTNDNQEVNFLSFGEFLESIQVPETIEMQFPDFVRWFSRHRVATGLKDPHQLFEEMNGVIMGSTVDSSWLSKDAYKALGVRQSIYSVDERNKVHDLFMKYVAHLQESGRHDVNILSYECQRLVERVWDFVVVDEVQDFTNVQLDLVLRSLKDSQHFILCGDSNQIVHPNFFSWSGLKRHFYNKTDHDRPVDLTRILTTNYRNSRQITEMANRILRLKHARFHSIDKESNHLVTSNAVEDGAVLLLPDEEVLTRELDQRSSSSTRFAVIVMHTNQKVEAKRHFSTPLIFSIQEAKGLEYDNIILFNFVSGDEDRFREITREVSIDQVQTGELQFGRSRDKSDKSLEIFKFHINALYVAATRAVKNIYLVESATNQYIFKLLGLEAYTGKLDLADLAASSLAEWQKEAQKLERQGKDEQAREIRERILGLQETPWQPLTGDALRELTERVVNNGGKKDMLKLFEYSLLSHDYARMSKLQVAGFRPASRHPEKGMQALISNHFQPYSFRRPDGVRALVEKYGVDHRDKFNFTPIMLAARFGNEATVSMLTEMEANVELVNSAGLTSFQIMLQQAGEVSRYALKNVPIFFHRLMPTSIVVMAERKLLKIDNHKVEFLFYNIMIALFQTRTALNATFYKLGLTAADMERFLKAMPRSIVPEHQTKRAYISQVLARNEVDRDTPYNRRIFKRTRRGYYILNPGLQLRVGEGWVPVYDLLDPETLFRNNFDHIAFLHSMETEERWRNEVRGILSGGNHERVTENDR